MPLYRCFIDYAKALILTVYVQQWEDVGHDGQIGFPVHIVQLVANTCSYKKTRIGGRRHRAWSEARLRDITRLYNTYSERIMLCVVEEHHDGITIGGRKDTNLRCADDTTLLCTCNDELLALLKRVK